MPNCTGAQFHEMVRSDQRLNAIPFIYMTGYAILRIATPLDKTGHDFMVNKMPFDRLLQLVDTLDHSGGYSSGDEKAFAIF